MSRELQMREALNEALAEEMARDEAVFLLGEEVAEYDGAYKVSRGLLARFGPQRVVDAPISEAGFVGMGIGAALCGMDPVVEVMTHNFAVLAWDQLFNHAAKWRYMSGGQFRCPLVVRGPSGAAHMLGAQHSQAFDAIYAHIPGLKVVAPSVSADAKGLLKAAIRDDNPVIFLESEIEYARKGPVPDGEHLVPLGQGEIKRPGADLSLVAWGRMVHVALEAAEALAVAGISAEVVDPRTLRPFDWPLVFESVRKTGALVVVQEGWPFAGVAAEVAARVQEACFDWLDAPVLRVTGEDVPMPYAGNLEEAVMATAEKVVAAARTLRKGIR